LDCPNRLPIQNSGVIHTTAISNLLLEHGFPTSRCLDSLEGTITSSQLPSFYSSDSTIFRLPDQNTPRPAQHGLIFFDAHVAIHPKQQVTPTIFAIKCHPKIDEICRELDEYFLDYWPWLSRTEKTRFSAPQKMPSSKRSSTASQGSQHSSKRSLTKSGGFLEILEKGIQGAIGSISVLFASSNNRSIILAQRRVSGCLIYLHEVYQG